MCAVSKSAATALLKSVGKACVSTTEAARFAASYDSGRFSVMPDAVVRPKTLADIAGMLACANRYRVPVTVRGGGSAMTGAAVPMGGGWVLDLGHWKKLKISVAESLAYAGPGVRIADLDAAAAKENLFYPPDPSSKQHATVGGSISTNAGGLHGAKYGVTRDYVVALEGFLPNGEFVRWGRPLRKYASGYNMRDLWIGAEGTLGVITQAVLKLIPRPAMRRTFLCAFASDAAALKATQVLRGYGVNPAVLEYVDRLSVRCAADFIGQALFKGNENASVLLVEVDGSPDEVTLGSQGVLRWAKEHALACQASKDEAQAEALWEVRRKCSPAMFYLGDAKLSEDVVLPMKSYAKFAALIRKLERETKLPVPVFGHAADGNFHVHFMYHRANLDECRRAEKGVSLLLRAVVDLGGAISGEHGIGVSKSPFFGWQHTKAEIAAQKAIKTALDPLNILNPHKIFEKNQVASFPPVSVKMPWDHKPPVLPTRT